MQKQQPPAELHHLHIHSFVPSLTANSMTALRCKLLTSCIRIKTRTATSVEHQQKAGSPKQLGNTPNLAASSMSDIMMQTSAHQILLNLFSLPCLDLMGRIICASASAC